MTWWTVLFPLRQTNATTNEIIFQNSPTVINDVSLSTHRGAAHSASPVHHLSTARFYHSLFPAPVAGRVVARVNWKEIDCADH